MIRRLMICSLVLALLLTACAPGSNAPQPPEILYGQDLCDECGMVIDEPRFAAALVLETGEFRKFDDVGDMFVHQLNHPELAIRAYFAHDHVSEQWVRGEAAFYVVAPDLSTPMGHGVAAFGDQTAAEQFAAEHSGAKVLTFDEMRVEAHLTLHH
jgi:copper chaperone NosL